MFQQSSSRNSHNKESKVKRGIQITLLLVVAIWLLNQFSKNEYTEIVHINFDPEEDIDFGRKVKAGSENVIIVDGQKSDFDEIDGDQVEAFGQYTEEKNENESFSKEKEESQEDSLNTSHTEINEQLNSKDESDDLSNSNKVVASGSPNDKDDVLELLGQMNSISSMDQNEGRHEEDNSDHGSELVTLDGAKEDTIKEITSQEERLLSSKDQSDGGVNTNKVEKETINLNKEVNLETEGSGYASSEVDKESVDPHENVKLEAEISSENNFEVGKEIIDTHRETKLETEGNGENNSGVEKESIDTHAENRLETEGNSDSNSEVKKETIDTHGETKLEPEGSSENNPDVGNETIETPRETKLETEGSSENNPEVANETIETLGETKLETDSSSGNGSEVEKETIGSQGEVELRTTDIANTRDGSISLPKEESEVSTDKESIDTVKFLEEHASDSVKNDAEEKEDSKSNEDALESKIDSISEDQNAGNESGKSSDNNENLENPSMKNNAEEEKVNSKSNQEAFESKGDITSEDQNAGNENGNSSNNNDNLENPAVEDDNFSTEKNTIFEDTTEPKPKEETLSEFGNDNASTGRNDNPESSSQGGKDTE